MKNNICDTIETTDLVLKICNNGWWFQNTNGKIVKQKFEGLKRNGIILRAILSIKPFLICDKNDSKLLNFLCKVLLTLFKNS